MDDILKEKVKNIILLKDAYTKEEMQLILWYLKESKGSLLDNVFVIVKKVINFINSNIKEDNK